MLSDLRCIDIRKLSEMFDPESRETYVSLYLNLVRGDGHFVERRRKACRSVLGGDRALVENLDRTMEKVERRLDPSEREKGQRGLVIFASRAHGLLEVHKLAVPVDDLMVVSASPYIRPLAALREEHVAYGLVVLDSHRARIYVVSSGLFEDEECIAEDIMKRHKKGGMSQARFQRLRTGAVEHFLKEVSEAMACEFARNEVSRIVIAGPGTAKTMLKEILPKELGCKVLGLLDMEFDEAESCLALRAGEEVREDERRTVSGNLERLRAGVLTHGLAVHGHAETAEALRRGQVELLLVCRDLRLRGWICERCQLFEPGTVQRCPSCGGRVSEIDTVEELVELAERKDTEVEFVDDSELLGELGGVAGILRYAG